MNAKLWNVSKKNFENYSRDAGTSDYEDKKKIDNYLHRYPKLKEIVDMIGRDTDPSKDERDSIIYKFLPVTVSKNSSAEEIDRVETGDNLERVLPVELSMPEDLFSSVMQPKNCNNSPLFIMPSPKNRRTDFASPMDKRSSDCLCGYQRFHVWQTGKNSLFITSAIAPYNKTRTTQMFSHHLFSPFEINRSFVTRKLESSQDIL